LELEELILPAEKVKRVKHFGESIFVGALSRLNNNYQLLQSMASEALAKLKIKMPCFNPFYNIFAQLIEIVHCLELAKELFEEYQTLQTKKGFAKNLKVAFVPNPGKGYAVIEAPRGILYHQYELYKAGNILHANIITPTAIFLANLEKDLQEFLVQNKKLKEKQLKDLIKTLIRAYDQCISCATH